MHVPEPLFGPDRATRFQYGLIVGCEPKRVVRLLPLLERVVPAHGRALRPVFSPVPATRRYILMTCSADTWGGKLYPDCTGHGGGMPDRFSCTPREA